MVYIYIVIFFYLRCNEYFCMVFKNYVVNIDLEIIFILFIYRELYVWEMLKYL